MIYETFDGLTDNSHDVCIVGAGPVGISLAAELDRLGFSVLLLEFRSKVSGCLYPGAFRRRNCRS